MFWTQYIQLLTFPYRSTVHSCKSHEMSLCFSCLLCLVLLFSKWCLIFNWSISWSHLCVSLSRLLTPPCYFFLGQRPLNGNHSYMLEAIVYQFRLQLCTGSLVPRFLSSMRKQKGGKSWERADTLQTPPFRFLGRNEQKKPCIGWISISSIHFWVYAKKMDKKRQ